MLLGRIWPIPEAVLSSGGLRACAPAFSCVEAIKLVERSTMKLRTGDPWMPAPQYSQALRGLTLNFLVRDITRSLPFHREVLVAKVFYFDADFMYLIKI
jgi:hypothetical protein